MMRLLHSSCRTLHAEDIANLSRLWIASSRYFTNPPQSRPARAGWHFCWWCCSIPSALTRLTNSHAIIYREVPERRRQLELTRLDSPVSPWMNEWMTGRAIECAKEMLDGRGDGWWPDGWWLAGRWRHSLHFLGNLIMQFWAKYFYTKWCDVRRCS